MSRRRAERVASLSILLHRHHPANPEGLRRFLTQGLASQAMIMTACTVYPYRGGGTTLALLRNRGFLLLWLGQFLGILADWALRTILLIWVFKLTRSGVAVSLVGLAEALPLLVLAPVAGVFVDRWNRAYTMAGAVLARAILVLPLLIVQTRADLPLLLAVALLANAASQFFMPAASAAVPVVVGLEEVGPANSLLTLVNSAVALIAPGGGAFLFALIGPRSTVAALAVIYLLAIPVLALVPAPRPAEAAAAGSTVAREMVDGMGYVRRSPLLLALMGVAFVALLGVGALSVLDVVFVTRALHLRAELVAILLSASGVGELLGGIAVWLSGRRIARHYHLLLGLSLLMNGLLLLCYSIAPTLAVAAAVLFLTGLGFPPLMVSFMTLIQLETEDAFMGRVMSLLNMGMAVAMVVSLASGGVLADLFGVRQVLGAGAALLAVSGLLSLLAIRRTPSPRSVAGEGTATAEPSLLKVAP
jgi:MFS family permease